MSCVQKPTLDYALGIVLGLAGTLSYLPQYYTLIKTKQAKGISELSLFILNIGNACLSLNSLISNWGAWTCYDNCSFWLCSANLLPLWQILLGWIMVVPLYIVFVRFKIRDNRPRWKFSKRYCIYDLAFVLTYMVFVVVVVAISLAEEMISNDNRQFFAAFAIVLGISAAICSSIVWIPQIIKLLQTRKQGSLSLLMFLIQTPGNLVIIFFQAVMFSQDWSTWITYAITFVEQATIVVLLLLFRYDKCQKPPVQLMTDDSIDTFSGQE